MSFAEWTTALCKETRSFQVLFACGAIEALRVVAVVHGFHPTISCFNGETASVAFGRKHFVPICVTVRFAILNEEGSISKDALTMCAYKTSRMEMLTDGIQTFIFDSLLASGTHRCEMTLPTKLAVQLILLFNETDLHQWATTIGSRTFEVVGTEEADSSRNEWASDLFLTRITNGNSGSGLCKNSSAPDGIRTLGRLFSLCSISGGLWCRRSSSWRRCREWRWCKGWCRSGSKRWCWSGSKRLWWDTLLNQLCCW